ncbi:MAG: HTTM domain-containing protein [Myxococcales bacterium]|nr:HTTM domain-containing protein [Myxococcales bacterium]
MARAGRLVAWALDAEGSTRPAALIRIGAVPLLWTCVGENLSLVRATGAAQAAEVVLFYAASLAALIGLRTRVATALTAAVLVHIYVAAGSEAYARFFSHHHQALLTFLFVLLVFAPAGRSLSVDRWLALRRAAAAGEAPPPERGPLWALRLIALQVSAVYLWSVVDKLSLDFISGGRLERIAMELYVGSDLPEGAGIHALFVAASWAVLILEVALGVGLWSARARRWLVPLGILFHAILFLAVPVCVFSALMVLLYLAYAAPEAVDRAIARLVGAPAPAPAPAAGQEGA